LKDDVLFEFPLIDM